MKLYEILLKKAGFGKKPGAMSEYDKIYNPIGCMIGSVLKVNFLDYLRYRFVVTEIWDYTVPLNGSEYKMVDYVLEARAAGEDPFTCRLRLVPDEDSASSVSHRAMLMTLYDDLAYNEDLHAVVRDDTLQFVVDSDEFLFVEMNKKDGWFTIWRGLEVEAFQVDVVEA